ncbi:HD family phosphohydrolase [Sungkyunkwania multivorans]|uniref:HD family phosphohydrolase n=1 Tax=Sungkyunkwania multivorans TaxID=1173618 RepID=A0ABW3CW79_9FLAO
MKQIVRQFYKNQSLLYKLFLYVASTVLIVYFFPKGGKFKYEFQKGKPWQYETLVAPFDFAIEKPEEELEEERTAVIDNARQYYDFDLDIYNRVKESLPASFERFFSGDEQPKGFKKKELKAFADKLLDQIYENGILPRNVVNEGSAIVTLIKDKQSNEIHFDRFLTPNEVRSFIRVRSRGTKFEPLADQYYNMFFDILQPNVTLNKKFTEQELQQRLLNISYTRGSIVRGERIIAKGEVVEGEKFNVLNSLKNEYESQLWSESNQNWIVFGYTILVALTLLMLLLFLRKYRASIYEDNNKVTFIFFNIIFMVFLTTLVVKYDIGLLVKYKVNYVYIVPLCILPLIIKAFFDARLGLFTHVLTLLLLGFIVPNSFEYIFLQIIAGIVTILTVSELYKRANLFISVGQITLIYIISYFAFYIIHEGNLSNIEWMTFGLFVINGLATLFAQPLIYIYEKIFGLVSDVSLLELSDTNSKLLKELSNKAPGTFHHSLQVANLAEAAANEIGANAMLVRVGALYHDIGKMNNPTYFTENQATSVNPHNELAPTESARIIIDHVIEGIKIAKRNNLPDRVIDFIRTHHGTTTVYYFYKQQEGMEEGVNIEDFRYPGPIPFSKETAILMMSDAVEAASKSLKEPTASVIDTFVEQIIDGQMGNKQFLNANITFKEIQQIKKVLKRKLNNIYHLRIEYPE